MLFLRVVQHLSWSYHQGEFLAAVQAASTAQRLTVLTLGGLIAGLGAQALSYFGGGAGEVSSSVWRNEGRLSLLPSLARGTLAIVSVGMGASLGREAAPQLVGGAIASSLSEIVRMPAASRQVLVAITGGAGLGCVYNMPLGGAVRGTSLLVCVVCVLSVCVVSVCVCVSLYLQMFLLYARCTSSRCCSRRSRCPWFSLRSSRPSSRQPSDGCTLSASMSTSCACRATPPRRRSCSPSSWASLPVRAHYDL